MGLHPGNSTSTKMHTAPTAWRRSPATSILASAMARSTSAALHDPPPPGVLGGAAATAAAAATLASATYGIGGPEPLGRPGGEGESLPPEGVRGFPPGLVVDLESFPQLG